MDDGGKISNYSMQLYIEIHVSKLQLIEIHSLSFIYSIDLLGLRARIISAKLSQLSATACVSGMIGLCATNTKWWRYGTNVRKVKERLRLYNAGMSYLLNGQEENFPQPL